MKGKATILILIFTISLFVFISPVKAVPPTINDLNVDPSPMWLNDGNQLSVSLSCNPGEGDVEYLLVELKGPTTGYSSEEQFSDSDFSKTWSILEPGTHTLTVTCKQTNEEEDVEIQEINVYELDADLVSPKTELQALTYSDESFDIEIDSLMKKGSSETEEDICRSAGFGVYLSGNLLESSNYFDTESGLCIVTAYTGSLAVGVYDLKVDVEYQDHTITFNEARAVKIKYPLELSLVDPISAKPLELTSSGSVIFETKVQYKGQPIEFTELDKNDFSAVLNDNINLEIDDAYVDDNDLDIWKINARMPKHEPGSYDLKISVEYSHPFEGTKVAIVEENDAVQFVLLFEGAVIDASGQIVSTTIDFVNIGKTIRTDNSGAYYSTIVPGEYDIMMTFPSLSAYFKNVTVKNDLGRDFIRFDIPSKKTSINGISTTMTVVLEFGLPFEEAKLRLYYDDSKVYNEENIEAFACHNWNFGARNCAGEWESIESDVDVIRNVLYTNVTGMSAFVVGERLAMDAYIEVDNRPYYLNDPMQLSGEVTDTQNNPIDNAMVIFTIPDYGITSSTTTTFGGYFLLDLNAPSEEGVFDVDVEIVKEPYMSYNTKLSLQAVKKKDIAFINVPDSVDVYYDTPKEVTFTIVNSGQLEITDARIYINGLAAGWYKLVPASINKLAPGESKEVKLTIEIPESYCISKGCSNYYPVTVQVESDQVTADVIFTTTLAGKAAQTASQPSGDASAAPLAFPDLTGAITGMFSASGSELNIVLVMAIIVVAFTFLGLRKRKRVISSFPRHNVMSTLKTIKDEMGQRK